MNFEEFKNDALRTESRPEHLNFSREGLHLLLEASIKMAKIADSAKKTMFYGKTLNKGLFGNTIQDLILLLEEMYEKVESGDNGIERKDAFLNSRWEPNLRITHGAIGMFTEAGEVLEAVVKQMNSGNLDMVNVAEELGDSDWYKAIIHDETGISEETVRGKVIAKLKSRYGEKFSNEAALNRDLFEERKVLETELI